MSKNFLLVFPYQVQNEDEFETIINRFEEEDYIIHIFSDIGPDNFDLDLLPSIINEVINDNTEKNIRVVVCSNVRELIFSWFRCYNHLVHDFIYIIDQFDSDLLIKRREYGLYRQLFNFTGIQNEKIEGKIYININPKNYNKVFAFVFEDCNFQYFCRLDAFEFASTPRKSQAQKKYIYNGCKYSFEGYIPGVPVSQVNLDGKALQVYRPQEVLSNLTNHPYFLFIYLKELLRKKNPNTLRIGVYCFGILRDEKNEVKERTLKAVISYIKEEEAIFPEKIFFLSLLAMLRVESALVSEEFMATLLADQNNIIYHYTIIYNMLFYNSRDLMKHCEDYYYANREEIIKITDELRPSCEESFPTKRDLNKKKIAFLVDQLLAVKHSPTKVTLDYALFISKHYPEYEVEIFVEDNFISCPAEIIIPYYYAAAKSNELKEEHRKYLQGSSVHIEYSDSSQSKRQRVCSMVRKICRFNPGVIITTSDISLTREVVYSYYPIVYLSLGGFNFSTLADAYLQLNLREATTFYQRFPYIKPEFIHEFRYGLSLPKATKLLKREEYGLGNEDLVLITVGNRLAAELDEEYLKSICGLLKEKVGLKWLIVGLAELKYLKDNYQDLLGKKIILLSYEEDLMALYNICDVYLNPRRHGGGISVAMAMEQGLPVVVFSDPSDGLTYVGEANGVGYDLKSYLGEIERLCTEHTYRTKKGSQMKKRISMFRMDYSVQSLFAIINTAQERYYNRILNP